MPLVDQNLRFGDILPNGEITRNVRVCAVTGQPIETGDMMVIVPGTGKFFRAKAPLNWPKNAAKFNEAKIELFAIAQGLAAKAVTPTEAPTEETSAKARSKGDGK